MKIFRNQSRIRVFSLFTAVIFLNMGFFLAEVSVLKITDRAMIENVCKLVLNGGLEEERDAHSGGHDAPLKIFPVSGDQLQSRHSSLFLIATRTHHHSQENYCHADHSQIFSPPPDYLMAFS